MYYDVAGVKINVKLFSQQQKTMHAFAYEYEALKIRGCFPFQQTAFKIQDRAAEEPVTPHVIENMWTKLKRKVEAFPDGTELMGHVRVDKHSWQFTSVQELLQIDLTAF